MTPTDQATLLAIAAGCARDARNPNLPDADRARAEEARARLLALLEDDS
jgi:hypothetical protein